MSDDVTTNPPKWLPTPPLPSPLDPPPPAVVLEAEFGARTRKGPFRPVNDDHYLIMRTARYQDTLMTSIPESDLPRRFEEYGYGMVVADGMGRQGEVASRLAISTLVHMAIYFGKWHVRVDAPIAEEMIDRAKRFYRSVDSTLLQASESSPRGLQSTLTAVYAADNDLFFAHIGHSRAYLFRDNDLLLLTRDHTLDNERAGKPMIADVGASSRDLQHIVTETLGGRANAAPRIDVEHCELLDGDLVLLCTNGLTDVADEERITKALQMHSHPNDQCSALVDLAANSGGNDDVTVLVAQYRVHS